MGDAPRDVSGPGTVDSDVTWLFEERAVPVARRELERLTSGDLP